jgi:adenosylcobinamide kinase / adenosylcobinamide-phosphate guanylyltransferase
MKNGIPGDVILRGFFCPELLLLVPAFFLAAFRSGRQHSRFFTIQAIWSVCARFEQRCPIVARVILITGGSRSGKSDFARKPAEDLPGPRAFVATCPAVDDEMRERIRRHQQERLHGDWNTIEEQLDLPGILKQCGGFGVILVDCLTLWVNNLMYEADRNAATLTEEDIERKCEALLAACSELPGTVILVTNEVGSGIVPEGKVARLFRDLVGRLNQRIAAAADEVYLVSCGIPITLKKGI